METRHKSKPLDNTYTTIQRPKILDKTNTCYSPPLANTIYTHAVSQSVIYTIHTGIIIHLIDMIVNIIISTIPYCLSPIVYWLLPIACCLLLFPIAYCPLPIAYYIVPSA